MTTTEGITVVLHPVSDLAKAKAVYGALLGVEPQADAPYYVGFEAAGQQIGLVPDGGAQGMTSPVAYWHVEDIEAKLAEVTAAGAAVRARGRGHRSWSSPSTLPSGSATVATRRPPPTSCAGSFTVAPVAITAASFASRSGTCQ